MRVSGWRWAGKVGARALGETARGVLVLSLCVLMADQPLLGANFNKRGPTAGMQAPKAESRVLHALDRLTFGPEPGEVAAVQAMGLRTWFEQQLNPETIDDSVLQARLAEFPAMQLPQAELLARYPSQQILRQIERQGMGLPGNPVERAIYADEIAFYKVQKAKQAGKAAVTADGDDAMMGAKAKSPGEAPVDATEGSQANMNGLRPALAKSEISATEPPQDQHVERLFKDLDAVKILNLPPDQRMRRVLAMSPNDFVSFRQSLSGREAAQFAQDLNPEQREIFAAMQNSTRMIASEEMQTRVLRDVFSNRQLEAVMTDFWLNHFNVYVRKNQNEAFLIPSYERDVIRPHALGKFEDLLVATAESPAMQMYLDNWESIGPHSQAAERRPGRGRLAQNPKVKAALKDRGLNENYGRELMELHTLGVNGGYTQKDVTEVSKVFTGWTITPPMQGGEFRFEERKHEPGSKTVLGKTIREDGMKEGLQVLHMLATSPSTAKFISTELAVRFVSDDPPASLVNKMSQAFLASDGDIKTVLRTMFDAPEFWALSAQRSKVKTPLEFVVSAVRASGVTVNNALPLVAALDKLGMPLYGMQTPNGYSWMSDAWLNGGALVSRMNFALVMTGDKLPGVRTQWTSLLDNGSGLRRQVALMKTESRVDPATVAKERRLEQILLCEPLSDKTRAVVLSSANDNTAAVQAAKEFQLNGAGLGKGSGKAEGLAGMRQLSAQALRRNSGPTDPQAAVMAGMMLGSPEFQRR